MNRVAPRPELRAPRAERPRRRPGPASWAGLLTPDRRLVLGALATGASAQPGGVLKDVAFDQNLNAQSP